VLSLCKSVKSFLGSLSSTFSCRLLPLGHARPVPSPVFLSQQVGLLSLLLFLVMPPLPPPALIPSDQNNGLSLPLPNQILVVWNSMVPPPLSRHMFHKSCVDPWLIEQRSCPMCKLDILKAYGLQVRPLTFLFFFYSSFISCNRSIFFFFAKYYHNLFDFIL
jgi:hypothetical protein